MMDAETQLIDYSPGPSHSGESSDSEESNGSDTPSHQPTQLLYTQLLDSYDRYGENMYDEGRTLQLDNMDMETQVMEDESFDDFRQKGMGDDCTMIIPSEDEASKDTQPVSADDRDRGASSEKDDEVDSALSPYGGAFKEKTSPWLGEIAGKKRAENVANFISGERSAGLAHKVHSNQNSGQETDSQRKHLRPGNCGAGVGNSGEMQSIPYFLKDSDLNKTFGFHRTVGSWHELAGHRNKLNEEQRTWEPAVGGLQPVDSDATSDEEKEEEDGERHLNTSSTYPGEANSSQNVSGRLSAYSSGNFCQQDLNKLPEPETLLMDDDWGGVNGEDLGIIGRIDEGGSNAGILHTHEATCPLERTPNVSRSSEGVQTAEHRSLPKMHSNSRTSGTIRTASLRASALRASSCSSSARYRKTPGGSQNEEVQNVEREVANTPTCDAPWRTTRRSAEFVTPTFRPPNPKGNLSSAVSAASVRSNSDNAGEFSKNAEKEILSGSIKGQIVDESSADRHERILTSSSRPESSRSGDKNVNTARKLFSGNEADQDDDFSQGKEGKVQKSPCSANEDGKTRKKGESMSPTIIDSQPEKGLERRSSFGSGLFSQGTDLSYLNFQSPGEDSQARALNMVDKLVWLNATDLSQEPQLEEDKAPARGPSAKSSLQSRVQTVEAKAGMNDPLGVFDWVDSQHDEAGIFFGSKGAGVPKVSSKSAGATGHPKQIGFGTRKFGVLDASGLRNKKIEKVTEIPSKSAANLEKPGLLPKTGSKDNTSEQHMRLGKVVTSAGLPSNLRQTWPVQSASGLDSPRWTTVNKSMHDSRGHKNVEIVKVIPDVQSSRREVRSKTELQRSVGLPCGQGQDALPNPTVVQDNERVPRVSELRLNIPDVQKCSGKSLHEKEAEEHLTSTKGKRASNFPPSPTVQFNKSPIASPRTDSPLETRLPEAAASSRNEKTECKFGAPVPTLAQPSKGDEWNQQSDGMLKTSEDLPCLNSSKVPISKQDGGSSWGTKTAGSPHLTVSRRILDDLDDEARSSEAVLQLQNPENAVREDGSREAREARVESGDQSGKNFEPPQFTRAQANAFMDYDVDGSVGAPGSVSSTFFSPEREAEDNVEVASAREINMGPDTLGAVEAMEMLTSDFRSLNGRGADEGSGDKEGSNLPGSDDDQTAGMVPETEDGVEGRHIVTRRSRTQGRHSTRVEINESLKGNQHLTSRTRRVSWAGPLEQVPRSSVGVRRGRSARHQENTGRQHLDENTSGPSSDQDDVEDVDGPVNGDRKRKAEFVNVGGSKDTDLDKIKKRFNMSDAAVARLLGTDEEEGEEEADISHSPGVKTRSVSHMQPKAEEDEATGPPKIGKVGKGLRSSRSRVDDGFMKGRRKRDSRTPSDQEKQGQEERTGSPCDTDAAETSIDRTTCVEMHPSDNETLPGRRRMRSIADVSSPSVKKTIAGRPPQSTAVRRGRGRRLSRPSAEQKADPSDVEQEHVPPLIPSAVFAVSGRPRGKRGPRSARKRKELEPLRAGNTTSSTSSKEASTTSSKETSKRSKREIIAACVLFSHGLPEAVGKQQRKIVAKLGGRATSSAAECTHFVADKFVRTGNMLEAMAAGKPVVTAAWLESCLEANCFVDEQHYILQDKKKEAEMGFSMVSSLLEARQRPLLQGIRVYITPGTSPGPDALARIVKAAGGQVVEEYDGPAPDGERKSDFCLVLSSEEEFELCTPFLEQGAKVFTPELLLSGVMCHNLDFSHDQLFRNFTNKRRRTSLSKRATS